MRVQGIEVFLYKFPALVHVFRVFSSADESLLMAAIF
jgi:hypothetical protein